MLWSPQLLANRPRPQFCQGRSSGCGVKPGWKPGEGARSRPKVNRVIGRLTDPSAPDGLSRITTRIRSALGTNLSRNQSVIPVVPGFVCSWANKKKQLLPRQGSRSLQGPADCKAPASLNCGHLLNAGQTSTTVRVVCSAIRKPTCSVCPSTSPPPTDHLSFQASSTGLHHRATRNDDLPIRGPASYLC